MVKKRRDNKNRFFISAAIILTVAVVVIYAFGSINSIETITSMTTTDVSCVQTGQEIPTAETGQAELPCCAGSLKAQPKDISKRPICCSGTCDATNYECPSGCAVNSKKDYIGVYRPSENVFYLLRGVSTDANGAITYDEVKVRIDDADIVPGIKGLHPITGDWDNDGIDEVGIYKEGNPKTSWKVPSLENTYYLKNANSDGPADVKFIAGRDVDSSAIGDWNGDGMDTWANPRNRYSGGKHLVYLSNENAMVKAFSSPEFGSAGTASDEFLSGDWDGDGKDTISFYNPTTGEFNLANSNENDAKIVSTAKISLWKAGNHPLSGDWDGDGKDTIGIYKIEENRFYLASSNENANSNFIDITYGKSGDIPIKGKFFASPDLCEHKCGDGACQSDGSWQQGSTCPETKENCPADCKKKCSGPDAYEGQISCESGKLRLCTSSGQWQDKRQCGKYSWETGQCASVFKYYTSNDLILNGISCETYPNGKAPKGTTKKSDDKKELEPKQKPIEKKGTK